MGVLDSSFLFFPFGNDLLVVAFVARHHDGWPLYVLSAVCGSMLGVFFLDLVARKAGEAGIRKIAGEKRYNMLKKRFETHLGWGLALGCLAPPPFPFTILVAITSAMGYPRPKLLGIVAAARAARFIILSMLAIHYGRHIIRIMNTPAFKWTIIAFTCLCLIGSVFSVVKWVKGRRSFDGVPVPALQTGS